MSQGSKQARGQKSRFTKLSAAGKNLKAGAKTFASVLDSKTGLTWSVEETPRLNWKGAQAHCAALKLCGFDDWRLPTCDELLTLVDRSRIDPAIDIEFFPACKSSWYWSATPYAGSPGVYAWLVDFSHGNSYWGYQDLSLYVRAVRASQ